MVDRTGAVITRDGVYPLIMDGSLMVRRLQRMPGGEMEASLESLAYKPFNLKYGYLTVTFL